MRILITSNGYPTRKNPTRQVFVKKIHDKLKERLEGSGRAAVGSGKSIGSREPEGTGKSIGSREPEGTGGEVESGPGGRVDVLHNRYFSLFKEDQGEANLPRTAVKYLLLIVSCIPTILFGARKYDIIYAHGVLFSASLMRVAARLHGCRLVCYVHGADVNTYGDRPGFFHSVIRRTLHGCDAVFTNSRYQQGRIKDGFDCDSVVVSPGYNSEVFCFRNSGEDGNGIGDGSESGSGDGNANRDGSESGSGDGNANRDGSESGSENRSGTGTGSETPPQASQTTDRPVDILFAGNAIHRKGIDILLQAILDHRDYYLDHQINVLIHCSGRLRNRYIESAEQERLMSVVSFGDRLGESELAEAYRRSKIFVFPSREEPLGMVGLEAIACGSILVASNTGGIKEYVEHGVNGFLFETEDPDDLHRQLSRALESYDDYRGHLAEIARSVGGYSLDSGIEETIRRFRDLLTEQ